jgi:hypothetical protein
MHGVQAHLFIVFLIFEYLFARERVESGWTSVVVDGWPLVGSSASFLPHVYVIHAITIAQHIP